MKPIWDTEVKVTSDANGARRKSERPSGLCDILLKIFIGIIFGGIILTISVIQERRFSPYSCQLLRPASPGRDTKPTL